VASTAYSLSVSFRQQLGTAPGGIFSFYAIVGRLADDRAACDLTRQSRPIPLQTTGVSVFVMKREA
jgi:hypothetical protein